MKLFYFVDLFELDHNANQKKIATFKLSEGEGGGVEIDGDNDNPIVENIKKEKEFLIINMSARGSCIPMME